MNFKNYWNWLKHIPTWSMKGFEWIKDKIYKTGFLFINCFKEFDKYHWYKLQLNKI